MKKKLELDLIEIKSFVTSINSKMQENLIGGDNTDPKSRVLACPTTPELYQCGRTNKGCDNLMTDDIIICEGLFE